MNKFKVFFFGFLFLFILVMGGYLALGLFVKKAGFDAKPKFDHPEVNVKIFSPGDARWKDKRIGKTQYTMGEAGGTLCLLSSCFSKLGIFISPLVLGDKLDSVKGITPEGNLDWRKIEKIYPGVNFYFRRSNNSEVLEEALKEGRLPFVKVKDLAEKREHWLMITGAKNHEFLAIDDQKTEAGPQVLSRYGKVFAYRILYSIE